MFHSRIDDDVGWELGAVTEDDACLCEVIRGHTTLDLDTAVRDEVGTTLVLPYDGCIRSSVSSQRRFTRTKP